MFASFKVFKFEGDSRFSNACICHHIEYFEGSLGPASAIVFDDSQAAGFGDKNSIPEKTIPSEDNFHGEDRINKNTALSYNDHRIFSKVDGVDDLGGWIVSIGLLFVGAFTVLG